MLTGDSPRTAASIAEQLGVDDFRAGVLPADKAEYVAAMRREGHTVLIVGDGIKMCIRDSLNFESRRRLWEY